MKKILIKTKNIFFKNYPRTFFSVYLLLGLLGGVILMLPISNHGNLKFIDSLFISISALSTTGLSPVTSLADTFTIFGKIVIMFITQIGGLGIYMLIANFWIFSKKKIDVSERAMLAAEQNVFTLKGIIRNIKTVFLTIISIEIISIIFLTIYFSLSPTLNANSFGMNLLEAAFLTTALFMNAGFEMFSGGFIFANFLTFNHYPIIIWGMILIFIGGMGFIPISETIDWFKSKFKKEHFKFSYVSKLLFWTHFGLWIFGGIVLYLLEMNGVLKGLGFANSITVSFFTSISTRSSGFSILNRITDLKPATQLFMTLLMFIGASPNSAGGGIRITTAILAIAGIVRFSLNKAQTKIGKRAYKENTVQKAMVALMAAISLIIVSVFIITLRENGVWSVFDVTFEVISAFGTVGYTNGLTNSASILTKVVLMFVMFIGRISIITFISSFDSTKKKQAYMLTEYDLMVS